MRELKENAREDEGQDGAAGRGRGRGRGRVRGCGRGQGRNNADDVAGADREVDASVAIGRGLGQGQGRGIVLGDEADIRPQQGASSLLPEKRSRGRPKKNSLLPVPTLKRPQKPNQPSILNDVASSPAVSASPTTQESPNMASASPPVSNSPAIPSAASLMDLPLKRKRGRPSKADLEQRAKIEEARKLSQISQSTETTQESEVAQEVAEVATTLAPSSQPPPLANGLQQHCDWPPQHQPGPRQEQASKGDPWVSWFPRRFVPSGFSNIQNMHVLRAEFQQPLVYGCSWPVYTIHRFYRPRLKRPKARRKPSTIFNTQEPKKMRAQAQTNEQLQDDMATGLNPGNYGDGLSYQGEQAHMNMDEEDYNGVEGTQGFSGMEGQYNVLHTQVVDQQGLAGQENVMPAQFVHQQGFSEQDAGQENVINNYSEDQQGLAGQGYDGEANAVNTDVPLQQGALGEVNAVNIQFLNQQQGQENSVNTQSLDEEGFSGQQGAGQENVSEIQFGHQQGLLAQGNVMPTQVVDQQGFPGHLDAVNTMPSPLQMSTGEHQHTDALQTTAMQQHELQMSTGQGQLTDASETNSLQQPHLQNSTGQLQYTFASQTSYLQPNEVATLQTSTDQPGSQYQQGVAKPIPSLQSEDLNQVELKSPYFDHFSFDELLGESAFDDFVQGTASASSSGGDQHGTSTTGQPKS